ncbi:MAG: hypothetical protein WCF85_14075 [Rhodospirillaceae bacterium]
MSQLSQHHEAPSSKAISDAMNASDVTKFPGWKDVADLSANTTLCDMDILDDIIIYEGASFHCGVNVYVKFEFPDDEKFPIVSDEFPGSLKGHVEGDNIVIDDISIDTTSFDG